MSWFRDRGRMALAFTALVVILLAAASLSVARSLGAPYAMPLPTNGVFRTLAGQADLATGTLVGTRVSPAASGESSGRAGAAAQAAIVLDPGAGLKRGLDLDGQYNGGLYLYGIYDSPVWETGLPVDNIVASWAADTPEGTWLEVDLRARQGDTWTKDYVMGVWASGTGSVRRHNAGNQEDARGLVDTDNLALNQPATAVQVRAILFTTDEAVTPRLRRLSVVATGPAAGTGAAGGTGTSRTTSFRQAWGRDLAVPERRQNDFPDGGGWCSPTSLSMLMAYWAGKTGNAAWDRTVPETAAGVTDFGYNGTGNWIFNTAYAAGLGLDSYVTRYTSFAGIERWIAAGIPVAINIEFGEGELSGAPMPSTDGHIIVIRGFDRRGNPIANDPASRADQGEKVRIVYNRAQLERAWQGRPQGTVYILFPPGYPTP